MTRYREVYVAWQADPDGFRATAAKAVVWMTPRRGWFRRMFDPQIYSDHVHLVH